MSWTSEPPTKPGLYWLHSPKRGALGCPDFVVLVTQHRTGLVAQGMACVPSNRGPLGFTTHPALHHVDHLPGDRWTPARPPSTIKEPTS